MPQQLFYGGVPVPYTASWTGEEKFLLAHCRFAGGRMAICQQEARGTGKPLFGKPHSIRQREVIARDLCDLCGRPLRNPNYIGPACSIFQNLWDAINGPGAWEANPWVVAYSFRPMLGNIDTLPGTLQEAK